MANHNVLVIATPLPNIQGRTDYISNPKRQEHLVAVTSTTSPEKEKEFWRELSVHCREQAKYSVSKKPCEGREFMLFLANELAEMDPDELVKSISKKFHELTGTENKVALHWNKDKTSYHCHVVCAENPEINQVKMGEILTRNTYYDEEGKRSTKKKCVDQDGNLRPGCSFIAKGDRKIERVRFGAKYAEISSKEFLEDVKLEVANLQNKFLGEKRFQVFMDDGIHIPEQRIGKNKTEEQKWEIAKKNKVIRAYNKAVDDAWGASYKDEELNGHVVFRLRQIRKEIKKSSGKKAGKRWNDAVWRAKGKIQSLFREIKEAITQEDIKKLIEKLIALKEGKPPKQVMPSAELTPEPSVMLFVASPEEPDIEPASEPRNTPNTPQKSELDSLVASAAKRAQKPVKQGEKREERSV